MLIGIDISYQPFLAPQVQTSREYADGGSPIVDLPQDELLTLSGLGSQYHFRLHPKVVESYPVDYLDQE